MANFEILDSVNAIPFSDFVALDFDDITPTAITSTRISGTAGAFTFDLTGSFTLAPGGISGGTLQGFSISQFGSLLATATGLGLDIVTLANTPLPRIESLMLAGDDNVLSAYRGNDFIDTYSGNDVIEMGAGNDTIDGGSGTDTLVLKGAFASAAISVSTGGIQVRSASGRDTVTNVELLRFDDRTIAVTSGTAAADRIAGDLRAGHLSDYIAGAAGNDAVSGLLGNDFLFGNAGNDRLLGNQGADLLNGGAGADTLLGGNRDDTLLGGGGKDTLLGGTGSDVLRGGGGKDRLVGQKDDDTLTGGGKADRFVFAKGHGDNRITDFEIGRDVIEIGRGAKTLSDLEFRKVGGDVLVTFADVEILVQDVRLSELQDSSNFDL